MLVGLARAKDNGREIGLVGLPRLITCRNLIPLVDGYAYLTDRWWYYTSYPDAYRVRLTEPACPGDITGDGATDQRDLGILIALWETCEGDPNYDPAADLDGDGCINHADLGILLGDWECGT